MLCLQYKEQSMNDYELAIIARALWEYSIKHKEGDPESSDRALELYYCFIGSKQLPMFSGINRAVAG